MTPAQLIAQREDLVCLALVFELMEMNFYEAIKGIQTIIYFTN